MIKISSAVLLLALLEIACVEKEKAIESQPEKVIVINKSFDTLGTTNYLDSFVDGIEKDCVSEDSVDQLIGIMQDSVREIKDQMLVRLNDESKRQDLAQYRKGFREVLKTNVALDSVFFDNSQSMFYWSLAKATERSYLAKCFRIKLLREYLLFLKTIFENSYTNYEW